MTETKKGTFADLYETELRVRPKRAGRPRTAHRRMQTTVYLTPEQREILGDLHYRWQKQFKVDRSEIAGLALELLAELSQNIELSDFSTFERLKFQMSKTLKARR